jgi:hypothetical protein
MGQADGSFIQPPLGADPPTAVAVELNAGDAIFFDRRILHAAVQNLSDTQRVAIFYGYSYRWLRPRDEMSVASVLPHCGPIRRQLLCVGPTGGMGFTSPTPFDTPLAAWLEDAGVGASEQARLLLAAKL